MLDNHTVEFCTQGFILFCRIAIIRGETTLFSIPREFDITLESPLWGKYSVDTTLCTWSPNFIKTSFWRRCRGFGRASHNCIFIKLGAQQFPRLRLGGAARADVDLLPQSPVLAPGLIRHVSGHGGSSSRPSSCSHREIWWRGGGRQVVDEEGDACVQRFVAGGSIHGRHCTGCSRSRLPADSSHVGSRPFR